ncbi:MAG: PAS domain-containing sensor histidine kinase [Gallionellaceae bacterium]|jgi:PAS domain S-box-containing protein
MKSSHYSRSFKAKTPGISLNQIDELMCSVNRVLKNQAHAKRTECAHWEAALHGAEENFRTIADAAPVLMWRTNADHTSYWFNKLWQEFTGQTLSQDMRSAWIGRIHPDDAELRLKLYRQHFDARESFCIEYRIQHRDGAYRWLLDNGAPIYDTRGDFIGYIGTCIDITERKEMEQERIDHLQQLLHATQQSAEKDLVMQRQARLAGMGEMIGNIAHQWRQPINSLGLILSDLEDASLFGECDLAYIQTATSKSRKIIQKMSNTIDDFRHFFRDDKTLGTFSLKKVTEECLNLVEAAMKVHNINIVVRCEQDVFVKGYANEYSQAVMNILSNAKDAIVDRKKDEGEIVIEISELGEFGVHTITDNGGGIPDEIFPKIFEPHFTTKEYGVGIGLYMTVVSIEKNMNGRIAVENVAEGARFCLNLPKAEAGGQHVIH